MSMSNRLQELRQKAQLSQEELAERIGVSRQAISKWESEQSNPDIENIVRLSEVYNISTDYILKGAQPTVIYARKDVELARQRKNRSIQYLIVSSIVSVLVIAVIVIIGHYIAFPDSGLFNDEHDYLFLSNTFTACGVLAVISTAIILNWRHWQKAVNQKAE